CRATGRCRCSGVTCGRQATGWRVRAATCGSKVAGTPASPGGPRVRLGRRQFLGGALALGATALTPLVRRAGAQPKFASTPFTLGVGPRHPPPDGGGLWSPPGPAPPIPGGGGVPGGVVGGWGGGGDEPHGERRPAGAGG